MKVLLTGGNGFVAGYAAMELISAGFETVLSDHSFTRPAPRGARLIKADLAESSEIDTLVKDCRPDACIHLGGIPSVAAGNSDPEKLFRVNVTGTALLLEAFSRHRPDARFLFVSTAHVYGQENHPHTIDEETPMSPHNLYALSKAAADMMTLSYARIKGMDTMVARPNNHIGPGQASAFVIGTLGRQIRSISEGKADPVLHTGNIESTRDFSDVRDVARAYRLLLEKGRRGTAYNIGSGSQVSIKEIISTMCRIENISPEIRIDPERLRPADTSPVLDTVRIKTDTGWTPVIPLEKTLQDILRERDT